MPALHVVVENEHQSIWCFLMRDLPVLLRQLC